MGTDSYYKVHKKYGGNIKVNKNGTNITKFQPGITGQESLSRLKKVLCV
jgi:hypothetical protein